MQDARKELLSTSGYTTHVTIELEITLVNRLEVIRSADDTRYYNRTRNNLSQLTTRQSYRNRIHHKLLAEKINKYNF